MKHYLFFLLLLAAPGSKAQTIDSIYINLYTDSLKRGTYNYINVDGLLSNGRYLPLDSTQIAFSASEGYFLGNSLWVDPSLEAKKIHIKVVLRKQPALAREFDMYIKQLPDGPLKTMDEIMGDRRPAKKKSRE